MNKIDTKGVYRGDIVESALGVTKKSDLPQWIVRLRATERYVDDPTEMEHYELTEPGWVDWREFNEEIVGYMVLFKDSDEFTRDTALLNYDQLQLATGWDGTEFNSLNDDSFVDKNILFRVEENEYEGKVSLQVNWVDDRDAPPTREMKRLDEDKVKDLSSRLKMGGKKAAAKPGKPAARPAKQSGEKPAAKGKTTPVPKAEPKAEAKPPAKKKGPPKKAAPEPEPTPEVTETEEAPFEADTLDPMNQGKAWEHVCDNKGDASDSDVQDAWIKASEEIGGDREEEDMTNEDWASVAQKALAALA